MCTSTPPGRSTASPRARRKHHMSTLVINDLHVSVDTEDGPKEILKGVTLTINEGETHAIMGPNGSGKSTLAYSIMGHPSLEVTEGVITFSRSFWYRGISISAAMSLSASMLYQAPGRMPPPRFP